MPALRAFRRIVAEVTSDIAAIKSRDPAARDVSTLEILAAWPGLHALLAHRLAHALYGAGVPFAPEKDGQTFLAGMFDGNRSVR